MESILILARFVGMVGCIERLKLLGLDRVFISSANSTKSLLGPLGFVRIMSQKGQQLVGWKCEVLSVTFFFVGHGPVLLYDATGVLCSECLVRGVVSL